MMTTDTQTVMKKKKSSKGNWWTWYVWPVARHFIIPLVCLLALLVGMVAGYVYLGGQPMSEVWKWSTWQHLYDLVFKDA